MTIHMTTRIECIGETDNKVFMCFPLPISTSESMRGAVLDSFNENVLYRKDKILVSFTAD